VRDCGLGLPCLQEPSLGILPDVKAVLSVQSAAEKAHTVKKAGEGKKKASPKKKVQAAAVLTSIIPPLYMTGVPSVHMRSMQDIHSHHGSRLSLYVGGLLTCLSIQENHAFFREQG